MGSLQGSKIDRTRRVGLPPDAESTEAFSTRAERWWKETILPHTYPDTTSSPQADEDQQDPGILVVSHGGLMHVLVQGLLERGQIKFEQSSKLGLLTRHWFPNASISVIELPVQSFPGDQGAGRTGNLDEQSNTSTGKGTDSTGTEAGMVVLFADTTHLSVEFVNGNADVVDG